MISVIIPIYNARNTIDRCVNSILSQTYKDFELILVNDGSTDDSGERCDLYAKEDARVVVIHTINKGVSSARNTGLDAAKGEWISFVDSDDWAEQDLLATLIHHSQDIDLIVSSFNNKGGNGQQTILRTKDKEGINSFLSSNLSLPPWAKLYKNEIIQNKCLRFDPHIRFGEDSVFVWNYASYCQSITIIDKGMYHYSGDWGKEHKKYRLTISEIEYTYKKKKEALDNVKRNWRIESYDKNLLWAIGHLKGLYEEYTDIQVYDLYCKMIGRIERDAFFKSRNLSSHLNAILLVKWYYSNCQESEGRQLINSLSYHFTIPSFCTSLKRTNLILYFLIRNNMGIFAHIMLKLLSRQIDLN